MEPSVGQRTGRTWVFVSVLSVRRFFPSSDCADEGSNGSNWMPKSLQTRGKETLHSCDVSRLEWDLQYLCKLVTKSQSVFFCFCFFCYHERCREPLDRTLSGDISCTVFHCPAVALQWDWVSTKTWSHFEFAQLSQSLFHNCLWHLLFPSTWFCVQPLHSRQEGGHVHSVRVRVCSLVY